MIERTPIPDRAVLSKKLQAAIMELTGRGVTPEEIALKMHMTSFAIRAWLTGSRIPHVPAIKEFERLFNVEILS